MKALVEVVVALVSLQVLVCEEFEGADAVNVFDVDQECGLKQISLSRVFFRDLGCRVEAVGYVSELLLARDISFRQPISPYLLNDDGFYIDERGARRSAAQESGGEYNVGCGHQSTFAWKRS